MANGASLQRWREFGQQWREYRASKATLFWSCVASVALTMVVGFAWAGWVTGGTASEMAKSAADQARAELAATACVDRFLSASDARAQLASLKKVDYWKREGLIEKGGWATLPGFDEPIADAAELCGERLATAELPAGNASALSGESTAVVK